MVAQRKFCVCFYFLFCFLIVVLLSAAARNVSAITIRGAVYSPYLEKLDKAIVTIDTRPAQVVIAEEGEYRFDIPPGNYTLEAEYTDGEEYFWKEKISAVQEGVYNIDIITQQRIGIEDIPEDFDIDLKYSTDWNWIWLSIIGLAFIILVLFFGFKRKKLELFAGKEIKSENKFGSEFEDYEDEFEGKIMKILKEEGGRMTQKDIRKKIGVSEAKVSLALADMENRGRIRKIKRGRANIIILNR